MEKNTKNDTKSEKKSTKSGILRGNSSETFHNIPQETRMSHSQKSATF